MISYCRFSAPLGRITIVQEGDAITHLHIGEAPVLPAGAEQRDAPLLQEACRQLSEYFAKTRQTFSLPLNPAGTEFQKKAWGALCAIPYGQTRTYKDMAEAIGCPKGFRAVGLANNKNPIAILIPCHRERQAGRLCGRPAFEEIFAGAGGHSRGRKSLAAPPERKKEAPCPCKMLLFDAFYASGFPSASNSGKRSR